MVEFRIPDLDLLSTFYENERLKGLAREAFKLAKGVAVVPLGSQAIMQAPPAKAEKPLSYIDQPLARLALQILQSVPVDSAFHAQAFEIEQRLKPFFPVGAIGPADTLCMPEGVC